MALGQTGFQKVND